MEFVVTNATSSAIEEIASGISNLFSRPSSAQLFGGQLFQPVRDTEANSLLQRVYGLNATQAA